MSKKIVFLMILSLFIFGLTGCTAKAKEFSGSGITITLTDDFVEEEIAQAPFYLVSPNHILMCYKESKSDLEYYPIDTLEDYINAVLTNGGFSSEIFTYNEDDVHYMYAYYSKTIDEVDYGYMLIVMEGENHFYSMNFGCLDSKLDSYKDQYSDWAKTIIVE